MSKHTCKQTMTIRTRAGVESECGVGVGVDTLTHTPIPASAHVALHPRTRARIHPAHIVTVALLALSAAIAPVVMAAPVQAHTLPSQTVSALNRGACWLDAQHTTTHGTRCTVN